MDGLKSAMRVHRRVLGVLPTGGGKTVCFAHITAGAMRKGRRVLILVHRSLILDQISAALDQFGVPHGRIEPGWPPTRDAVQIGMVQTVARRMDRYPAPDLIIPDECVHGDTKIITEKGEIAIRDVQKARARYVLSHENGINVFKPIIAFWSSGTKPTIRLLLSNGESIICTPDHLIKVGDRWIKSAELNLTDRLVWFAEFANADAASLRHSADGEDLLPNSLISSKSMSRNVCNIKSPSVISISPCGDNEVFDITVAGTHCFYANGILVHNCHHCVGATYERVLAAYPQAFVIGVTATPERLDGRGLGAYFSTLVLGPEIPELIDAGYLADYEYYGPPAIADLSSVPTVAGDYARDALSDVIDKPTITGSAVDHYRTRTPGRPSIWFCVSLTHAEHVAEEFREAGFPAASIDGTMSDTERRARLGGLADGSLQVLTSCDLIGEGVDVPAVSVIGHLRPTKSLAMKKQFDGRGLRLKPDGSNAVIFDHVGNSALHGTPRKVHAWSLDSRRRKVVTAAIKQCLGCYRVFERAEVVTCADPRPGCLARPREAPPTPGRQIQEVAGNLVRVTDGPTWAGGASLVLARGDEYRDLLARARTPEQLREIARARGYKRGWEKHILKARRSTLA